MTMYDIRAVYVPFMCPLWEKKQDLGGCSMAMCRTAVGQLLGPQVTFNAAGGACGRDNVWPMAAQLFQELGEAFGFHFFSDVNASNMQNRHILQQFDTSIC